MAEKQNAKQHVFIIGAKSIGQYGGYETFVDKLAEYHKDNPDIQYHIACKANGEGYMNEAGLQEIDSITKDKNGNVTDFYYHNAHAFKIKVPSIGPGVAVYYDLSALKYSIRYCIKNKIEHPIFYILTSRIGPFIGRYKKKIEKIGGRFYLNPDGHEWMRAKWSAPVKRYWKLSEKLMVKHADLVICDSKAIEQYIQREYAKTETTYISYGAEVPEKKEPSVRYSQWLRENKIFGDYMLVVGRFVPENNYETMIREFRKTRSKISLVFITNRNDDFLRDLDEKYHIAEDTRIRFVGPVYDKELLIEIRQRAAAYIHGHEVGGTNPSLLEALGCTDVNLIYDVSFNKEVAGNAALYWTKEEGSLSSIIDNAASFNRSTRDTFGLLAKKRIRESYSWDFISSSYAHLFTEGL